MKPLSRLITSTIAAIPVGAASGAAITIFLSASEWNTCNLLAIGLFTVCGIGFMFLALIHNNIMDKFITKPKPDITKPKPDTSLINNNQKWRNIEKEVMPRSLYFVILGFSLSFFIGALYFSYKWKSNHSQKNIKQEQIIEKIPSAFDSIGNSINEQQRLLNNLQDSIYKWHNDSVIR